MNKSKGSLSFTLQNHSSLISREDNDTNSDYGDQNSLDSHRVPCFGGQQEQRDPSSDEANDMEDRTSSDEEDEADLLSELRQLSKNITNGIPGTSKKQSTGKVNNIFDDLAPVKKTVKEFDDYYQKSVQNFLKRKENEIDKLRKMKEETEATELKNKPELVAKQQKKKHIPIADRVELIQAKKERELMKLKKQQEEKLEKEMSELTFAPKINTVLPGHLIVRKRELSPSNKKQQQPVKEEPKVKVNKTGGRNPIDSSQKETASKSTNNVQTQPSKANKQEPQSQKASANPPQSKAIQKPVKSSNELLTQAKTAEKKTVVESVRAANMTVEKPKTPLKSHRDTSPVPSKETDIRNYRSQDKPEKSATDDFLSEQEALVQKFYDMMNGSPQKQVSMNKLESLMNYYSEHKSPGSQSERQNRIVRQPVAREESLESAERVSLTEGSSVTERNSVKSLKRETVERESQSRDSLSPEKPERNQSTGRVLVTPLSQRMEVLKEEPEEQEENEIDNIKQNLMSIQDNIQTLKQSFKNFQDAQASSKTEIPPAPTVETPKKSQQIVLIGNLNQQVSQQGTEKKASVPTSNPMTREIQAIGIKKEAPKEEMRSKTPPPTVVVMKKSPPSENKVKQTSQSPTPAQKRNSQMIKTVPETGGYSKKVVKPAQEVAQVKVEEKKEMVQVEERTANVNEIEHLSFGNVSFSGSKSGVQMENKIVENVNVRENVLEERKEQLRKSEGWTSWKNGEENGESHRGTLEPTSLFSKPKTNNNTQSLKDIAQMTLMKFKGLAPKTNGTVDSYVSGYASMKRAATTNK